MILGIGPVGPYVTPGPVAVIPCFEVPMSDTP
jgi:hypothetical protein